MLRKIFVLIVLIPLFGLATTENSTVHVYTLANGLQLFVKENHRAPVVLSSVWYKVGSGNEQNGTTGIAHVLEHMMFRGTKKYGPGVLESLVNENGGQQNAMTTNDFTMYYQYMPANKLPLVLQLEADRMQNLLLNENDFKKELQVVMEERRMRIDSNPNAKLYERVNATALVNNPYHHLTIGWMTDIENITLADLKNWYDTWYAPNNAFIVVVGDVKPSAVYALVKKDFAAIPKKELPTLKPRSEIKSFSQKRVDAYLPAKQPTVYLAYVTPTITNNDDGPWQGYALDLFSSAFCDGDSSRLTEKLVRQSRIANSIECDYNEFYLHRNLFTISAVPNPPNTTKTLTKALLKAIASLKAHPITNEELARIKTQVMAQKIYSHDSLESLAYDIGIPVAVGLPWQAGEDYTKNINAITAAQVNKVAQKYLTLSNLTIGVLHPLNSKSQGN